MTKGNSSWRAHKATTKAGRRSKKQKRTHNRTIAGDVTIRRADGTTTVRPAYSPNQEARVLGGGKPKRGVLPTSLYQAVIDRDGFRCRYCGKPCRGGFEVDHVYPVAKGGRDELANLVMACRSCNQAKGTALWQPR